jgi:hypothetical protein
VAECTGLLNRRVPIRCTAGSNPALSVTADDGQCQETPNAPENKGETDPDTGRSHAPNTPPIVQADDCNGFGDVPHSDKPDDKQNDKLQITDPDLQQVVNAWADLPEAVKAGILAMVASQP